MVYLKRSPGDSEMLSGLRFTQMSSSPQSLNLRMGKLRPRGRLR